MPAHVRRRAKRRTVVFVRTDLPVNDESIALAPPVIDVGGDCEFTCAQCGKVLAVADPEQLGNLLFYCQSCEAFNALGHDRVS
jgi:hypothetical protein